VTLRHFVTRLWDFCEIGVAIDPNDTLAPIAVRYAGLAGHDVELILTFI